MEVLVTASRILPNQGVIIEPQFIHDDCLLDPGRVLVRRPDGIEVEFDAVLLARLDTPLPETRAVLICDEAADVPRGSRITWPTAIAPFDVSTGRALVAAAGGWTLRSGDKNSADHFLTTPTDFRELLPLLERSQNAFRTFVDCARAHLGAPRFPLSEFLAFALAFSPYWAGLAISWLSDDLEIDTSLRAALNRAIDDVRIPQRARQLRDVSFAG